MKLLVICEPRFCGNKKATVNLAMNEILYSYQEFFDEVHCLVPADVNASNVYGKNGIVFHTVDTYKGGKIKKFLHQFKKPVISINEIVEKHKITHIQIRVPSTFSISFYNSIMKIKKDLVVTTYVAGDVYDNLVLNFKKVPFIKFIAKYLERQQNILIRETTVVTTGDVLKEKYKYLNKNIHAFYSTTHNDIILGNNNYEEPILSIVFVGRVDVAKRLDILIKTVNELTKNGIEVKVNIIGDGPQLKFIKAMVNEFGIEKQFSFYGYVNDRKLIDKILLNSSIFVLTSITEGTAKVPPEAMSRGVVPIAVKNVGSNNYIIQHNVNGFLVKKNDYKQIAEILSKLNKDRQLIKRLQKEAYTYAKFKTAKNEITKMWEFILSK